MILSDYIVILVTASKAEEAELIVKALVEERLAACCNIVPSIQSVYRWEGKICSDTEILLVIKTKKDLFGQIERRIRELHSYQVPEIIALSVHAGSEPYLQWLAKSTDVIP